ncbi:MAG: hypothetical protein AB1941_09100 [Gemmatimonadota bacterium]
MTTLRPTRVGSDPDAQPPETAMELSVAIVYSPALSPDEMLAVSDEVCLRIRDLLDPARFADLPVLRVYTDADQPPPRREPLYPLTMGALRMTCRLDLVEAIEKRCGGTDLARVGYDLAGRAYEVGVEVKFQRRPELDEPGVNGGALGSGG